MTSRNIPVSGHQDEVAEGRHKDEELAGSAADRTGNEGQDHDAVITMLEARVKELEQESETLREQRLRAIADLDNTRRRAEQDVLTTVQYANENLLKKLLPIVDDFERSVENVPEDKGNDPFVQGVMMIRNKMVRLLEEEGVEKIAAAGEPFDVNLHEALMRQPSDQPENTVVQELEPGYMYKGKVLRHAKVIVSA